MDLKIYYNKLNYQSKQKFHVRMAKNHNSRRCFKCIHHPQ